MRQDSDGNGNIHKMWTVSKGIIKYKRCRRLLAWYLSARRDAPFGKHLRKCIWPSNFVNENGFTGQNRDVHVTFISYIVCILFWDKLGID